MVETGRPVESLLEALRRAGYPDAGVSPSAPTALVIKVDGMQRSKSGKT